MKRLVVVLLLAMAVTAHAELSPRLDSLRVTALRQSNLPTTGTDLIDTLTVNSFVNLSVEQVCQDFPALQEFDTVLVDSASEGGALATDFDRARNVYQMLGDTLRVPLYPCGSDAEEKAKRQQDENQIADPDDPLSPRCYKIHDNQLVIEPKWRRSLDTAQFLVEYYGIDTTLTANSSQTSIETKYLKAVVLYTQALIAKRQGNYLKMKLALEEYQRRVGQ